MKNRKTFATLIIMSLVLLLSTSCRWDVWGSEYIDYGEGTGGPSSYFKFAGAAPQYMTATQARFSDKIIVSWNAVTGADYYEVFRAETPSTIADQSKLEWVKMTESPVGTNTFIDRDIKPEGMYVYRVRAMNFAYGSIIGEYSKPAYGWLLTPPGNVLASQGEDSKVINIRWTPVPNVIGYRLYWSDTGYGGTWNVAIPKGLDAYDYVFPANVVEFDFEPDKQFKGASLFFYVESCSQSGDKSAPSVQRMGYTLLEGAPKQPQDITASRGDELSSITVSWNEMYGSKDGSQVDYDWEIYRSADSESEKKIYSTLDGDALPAVVDGRMVVIDRANLKPGVTYTYSVRAIGKVTNESGQEVLANGVPAQAEGFLLSPPTVIKDVAIVEVDGKKGFQFSFEDALGATEAGNEDWSYTVYASADPEKGWSVLPGYEKFSISDASKKTVFSEYTGPGSFEYFDIKTYDGLKESVGYSHASIAGKPIAVFRPHAAESFRASDNAVFSGIGERGGYYPVALTFVGEKNTVKYNVRVWKTAPANVNSEGYEEMLDVPFSQLPSGDILIGDVGTTPFGTRYYYAVQGVDTIGREGEWSSIDDGYSAITGNTLIRYMQPYCLKPWEYIGKPVLTSEYPYPDKNVNQKWTDSAIYGKIKQAGTGSLTSGMTETSYFHGGKIKYAASVKGIGAKISFTYTNFGEIEHMKNNGFFTMEVDAGGTGSCTGNFQIDGMYPASIGLGNISVTNQAFTGTYTVRQSNGTEAEEVSPNQR